MWVVDSLREVYKMDYVKHGGEIQNRTVNFFFKYSEVFDALLIWSQYLKGFENIVKLFHY